MPKRVERCRPVKNLAAVVDQFEYFKPIFVDSLRMKRSGNSATVEATESEFQPMFAASRVVCCADRVTRVKLMARGTVFRGLLRTYLFAISSTRMRPLYEIRINLLNGRCNRGSFRRRSPAAGRPYRNAGGAIRGQWWAMRNGSAGSYGNPSNEESAAYGF